MTLTYNKDVAASYNQQLQEYQVKIGNGTITDTELNQAKEVVLQYYEYLNQSGIAYGSVATEVVESSTFYGAFANGMISDALQEANPSYSESQIQSARDKVVVSLALEDSFLRKETDDGTLTSREIADYHYDVFSTNNLPKEAWGGAIFEEFIGTGSWMEFKNNSTSFLDDLGAIAYEVFKGDGQTINGVSEKNALLRVSDFSSTQYATGQWLENLATDLATEFRDTLSTLVSSATTIGTVTSSFLTSLTQAEATQPVYRRDPLTLDLDGDGIDLVSLSNSSTFFDLDNDGLREQVGWVKADDGFLVYDSNNNSSVDNVSELFGYENEDGSEVSGTEELRTYDLGGNAGTTNVVEIKGNFDVRKSRVLEVFL